jgi:hypothetical protein
MKDSFVLYNSFYDPIKSLKNEQLGKLFRSIFNYTINGEITQDSEILIAFMFIKNQLDIDSKKWEQEKQKRSEAGKKGMASRWNNKDNNVITNYNKNNNVINAITKITDNVNENENENENDNVNDNDIKEKNIIKKKIFKKPTIDEIKDYCIERNNNVDPERFFDFYESKDWMIGKNKMKDWKSAVRTWEKSNKSKEVIPSWFNKEIKKDERTEDEERQLQELIRGY